MSEYTKGPWKQVEQNGHTYIVGQKGEIICECIVKNLNKIEEIKANYQLIKTAPELLGLLIDVLQDNQMVGHTTPPTLNKIEKTISKVKEG